MISHAVVETVLGGGLAGVTGTLVWQARAKRGLRGELAQARASLNERLTSLEWTETALRAAQTSLERTEQSRRAAEESAKKNHELADHNYRFWEGAVAETAHLAKARLPALVDAVARRHPGVQIPGLNNPELSATDLPGLHTVVEDVVREAVEVARVAVGRSARAGVRGMADEAQTVLARCQMLIFEELEKPPVSGQQDQADAYRQFLINFDHLVTRALHSVQRLRILAGSWPGIQRADCTFREVIESARGRIDDYQRIVYHYLPETAEVFVEGRVAEPLAVALAELFDNATSCSSGEITVYLRRVETGYTIVTNDSGLGLNAFQRADAQRLLTQVNDMDVTSLDDERKLGFAVIGRLATTYGFGADVSEPSPAGGVSATLLVPRELLGERPADVPVAIPLPDTTAGTRPVVAAARAEAPPALPVDGELPALPQRTRRGDIPVVASVGMEAATDSTTPESLAQQLAARRQSLAQDLKNFPAEESDPRHA
ncbi:histidine kinase [Streptomyces sp. NBC_00470]|uniref:histidine kinase n=1 Tax=Streptomyces sp. NBC_00470 TaxID=2975753 RepID=UPI002F907679